MTIPDPLERSLREAFSHQAAQLDSETISRLRAIDYHPRRRRLGKLPAVGAFGATGIAAAVAAIVSLGASAAPAFAGWQPAPTAPTPGQLTQAAAACGQDLGTPVITDSRGPYTAAIYADPTTDELCLQGDNVSLSSSSTVATPARVPAGLVQLGGGGTRDSAGNALTVVDGRVGVGVTAVTVQRSDGSSVQATVENGWYLAWWPGGTAATNAQITTASGTSTVEFPPAPAAPVCPTAGNCSSGYSYSGSGPAAAGHSGASGYLSSTTSSN
jgi:hypothetical protein